MENGKLYCKFNLENCDLEMAQCCFVARVLLLFSELNNLRVLH